jgi:hypothetical protein
MGFQQSPHEAAVYPRGRGGNALLVGVYIDDLVITGTKEGEVEAFKEEMKVTFQIATWAFSPSTWVSRSTRRIVELGGLTGCNPAHTPMEERLLSRDNTTKKVDAMWYRRIVGSLRYLVHTRSDLAFAVGYVSRFMQRSTMEHE